MCIDINMSNIEKVFHYEESELSVVKCNDQIWFRAKTIVKVLAYAIQCKAILDHVDPEDKRKLSELASNSRGAQNGPPLRTKWTP